MKKYDSYKATGIAWLPEVPEHWEILRGKNLYTKLQRPVRACDEVVTCFRDGMVTLRKNRRTTGFTEAINETGYQGIRKGDLVIHVMDAFAGAIGVSDSDGKGTPVYSVCQAKLNLNNEYYAFLLRKMARAGFIQSLYRGIRERSSDFRFEVFAKQFYPVPPREEQDQIVSYLDWKVSDINKLINLKQQEIAELKELKKATISDVVTHGLDKNVPMKDSGIDWIGKIPEHWELKRNKNIFTEQTEIVGDNASGYDLLSLTLNGVIRRDLNAGGKFPTSYDNYKIVKVGYMVLCLFDIDETPRTVGLSKYDGMITGAYTIMKVENINPLYAYFYYLALDNDKLLKPLYSGLRKTIKNNVFQSTKLPVPPREEQQAIADFLDARCADIDKLIAAKHSQVDALHDLKSRLVADAVTGQVDVRAVEIPDYEKVEEVFDETDDDTLEYEDEITEEV